MKISVSYNATTTFLVCSSLVFVHAYPGGQQLRTVSPSPSKTALTSRSKSSTTATTTALIQQSSKGNYSELPKETISTQNSEVPKNKSTLSTSSTLNPLQERRHGSWHSLLGLHDPDGEEGEDESVSQEEGMDDVEVEEEGEIEEECEGDEEDREEYPSRRGKEGSCKESLSAILVQLEEIKQILRDSMPALSKRQLGEVLDQEKCE